LFTEERSERVGHDLGKSGEVGSGLGLVLNTSECDSYL